MKTKQPSSLLRSVLILCLLAAVSSCDSDGGGGKSGIAPGEVKISGRVLDVRGEPLGGVPVEALGTGSSALTAGNGTFTVVVYSDDPRILVGGTAQASYVVRIAIPGGPRASAAGVPAVPRKGKTTADGAGALARKTEDESFEIARPFFLEFFEDGYPASLPENPVLDDTIVDDPSLPGLSLTLPAGTLVTFPPESDERILLLGMATDRLPVPPPDGRLGRMALTVGPEGLLFDRPVALSLPNADGLAPGSVLDLAYLDPETGLWSMAGELEVDPEGIRTAGASITGHGTFLALPRVAHPTTTIVGRVIGSGNEPVGGYQVFTQGGYSARSDEDGRFEIPSMPVWPDTLLRLQVISPLDFRFEFVSTAARLPVIERGVEVVEEPGAEAGEVVERTVFTDPVTDFETIRVSSILLSTFPPTVTYSPRNGQRNVPEVTRVVVTFGVRMDLSSIDFKLVRGISREQGGVRGTLFLRPLPDTTQLEFVPLEPLLNDTFYTIFIPKTSRDLEDIVVDKDDVSSRFYTQADPAVPGERGMIVHSIEPNEGYAGDEILIRGENLFNGQVMFGGVEARTLEYDSIDRRFIIARVPTALAGEVSVTVKDLENKAQGGFPFRPTPFIDSLDETIVLPSSRRVTGRGAQIGSSPIVYWNGTRGGSLEYISDEDLCPEDVLLQSRLECFAIHLPEGVLSGNLYLEVDRIRTFGFFAIEQRPVDTTPPAVVSSSVADGGELAFGDLIVIHFSEWLDDGSRVSVLVDGAELAGVGQDLVHLGSGVSQIEIEPPDGGWPVGSTVAVSAASDAVDLAGNVLDQDAATPERDPFEIAVTAVDPDAPPPPAEEEPPAEEPPAEEPPAEEPPAEG
ncbi:MAG: hypothetical protein JXA90_15815 [Planctomycetes bacterium]|nr:hypothetical protein [Planctomycetota bacterium]